MDIENVTEDQLVNNIMDRLMVEVIKFGGNNQKAIDGVQTWLKELVIHHPGELPKITRAADRAGELYLKLLMVKTSSSVPPGEKIGQPTIKRGEPA